MPDHAVGLNAKLIETYCMPLTQAIAIEVVAQTGSTNADLLARVATLSKPTLLAAETQTAGRGRAGRSWLSAPGSALTFSLAWPFSSHSLLGLPLAIGVALAEALKIMDVTVQLKWPNDVLREGKKLAGILIETAQTNKQTWAVIGVGLNLRVPIDLETRIGHEVAELTWLAQMDKNQLLAILLRNLIACLESFEKEGFIPFVSRWNTLHAFANKPVTLIDQSRIVRKGLALGVDRSGRLQLLDRDGIIWPIMAGDVSLRLD